MIRTLRRFGAFMLVFAMLAAMLPQVGQTASAGDYTQPYLNKMVEWGFMRGDIQGNLDPERNITRAEFVTVVNRAFGYKKVGSTPFKDVKSTDWYAEDIAIAYTAGYIQGTSKSTFSPLREISREEAAVILARNMMMQPGVGENTSFTDGRELSDWSSGLVATAASYQIINGYPDGSFRPQNPITRGEVAIMMVKAIGTPLSTAGEYTLGSVYGNVFITSSGVTLRNTTIAGNLYITEGVDLGSVLLENVTVTGEIIVSGGGVSESGDDSVVLRNVNAPKLVLDNLKNQQVSLRMEGDGIITTASVRTDAFLADNTPSGYGILKIELDGEDGLNLKLAGNVKEVVNLTPKSYIAVASGRVDTITVDEKALNATLEIARGSEVGHVNLDVGTTVTGDGDIENLTVNADGSTVSMLPDQIVIRPGVDAVIDGEEMDTAGAAEASAFPRMLAGYPKVTDLAPTSATVQFSANKRGTVYWAVTSVTDGSVSADELINPPSYSSSILKHGTVTLGGSGQPATAKISGLTSDGSYYVSAVFVDAREDRSTLKVISFTTPDNTVPNFASGYPYMSKVTNISAQVTVMATKTCRLYWAVLPKGASAPTAQDFKANAVTGNLGFGSMDVNKNTPYSFDVNNVPLEELESYDLYLWLSDVDGGQSSSVKKLTFTTVDKTPPVFNTEPTVNNVKETSVGMYANLNEAGTLYWVVVKQGEEYPKPLAGQSGAVDLASDTAKLQVAAGMNALKSGKVNMSEDKDVSFTVSGLSKESAYDFYYVAQDKAGNYSATVKKLTIHTLDPNAPTVSQEFTKYNGTDTSAPLPNTDIRLVFSEAIQDVGRNRSLEEYYQDVVNASTEAQAAAARETMANVLRNCIKLYVDTGNGLPSLVGDAADLPEGTSKADGDWIIDYRYAEIKMEEGKTVVTFPTKDTAAISGLNLRSGAEYYFEIEAGTLADTSATKNIMGKTTLDRFKTVFAIVNLSNPNITSLELENKDEQANRVDVSWTLSPMTTESTTDSVDWDMLIWSDTSVVFELYSRYSQGDGWSQWQPVGKNGNNTQTITVPDGSQRNGVSLTRHFLDPQNNPDFDQLNTLKENTEYQYAIHFTQIGSLTDPNTWSQRINIRIDILAGSTNNLQTLANNVTVDNYELMVPESITNIGQPSDYTLIKQFSDQTPPSFASGHPTFRAGSSAVNMFLMLDRPGTVYYVVAPKGTIPTTGKGEDGKDKNFSGADYGELDTEGQYDANGTIFRYDQEISTPARLDIVNASTTYGANPRIKYDSLTVNPSEIERLVSGLEPNQPYIVYFVIQGMSNQTYSPVYAYAFQTTDVDVPYITLEATNPEVSFTTTENANLDYALFAPNQLPSIFKGEMKGNNLANPDDGPIYSLEEPEAGEEKQVMTVLEAMLQTKDRSTGQSYFDFYASQDLKDDVQEIIQRRQTGGGTPVSTGKLETEKEIMQQVDFTQAMQSTQANNATYFYCLATAQNALGSAYSFKAVDNVHIPDTEPPYLISIGTTVTNVNEAKKTYSGTLNITFNESMYCMDELPGSSGFGDPDTLRPLINRGYGTNGADGKPTSTSILTAIGNPSEITAGSTSTSTTRTFRLNFKNITPGYQITLPTGMVLSDAAMNSTSDTFILEFQTGGSGQDGFLSTGKFVVIRGDYRPET